MRPLAPPVPAHLLAPGGRVKLAQRSRPLCNEASVSQPYRKSLLAGGAALAAASMAIAPPAAVAHARSAHGPADVPPPSGAHPGQCFAKVREPDAVQHTRERVLVKPASSVTRTIPAVTRVVEKTVVVTPASEQTVVHPAVVKSIRRPVLAPGPVRLVDTPARYRLVSRRVLVEPAHTVWKRGAGRPVTGAPSYGQTAYEATGEVMCRVLVPARYAVTTERVLVAPASQREVQGPPVLRHLREQVQVSPERVETIVHRAVTRIVRETVVVTPARTVTTPIPAQYRTVERTVAAPRYGWTLVVCTHPAAPRPAPQYLPRPYLPPQDRPAPYGERG